MNPFGIGLIFIIIIIIMISRSSLLLFKHFLILEFIFSIFKLNYGYFFLIGSSEIQYSEIILALTFISGVFHLGAIRLHRKTVNASLVLIGTIIFGIIILVMFPPDVMVIGFENYGGWDGYLRGEITNMAPVAYSTQSILMLIRACIFVTILVIAKSLLVKQDWIEILHVLILFAKILILFGLIEIIFRYVLNVDLNPILNQFFGRGISTGGGLTRLQGLSREPSHYALALFNMSILFLVLSKMSGNVIRNLFWFLSILLIGSLANSFSFFVCILSFLILLTTINSIQADKFRVLSFSFYTLVAGVFVFAFLLYSWFENSNLIARIFESGIQAQKSFTGSYVIGIDYGSEASRIIGMVESFRSYLARPIFGLGIGTTYCVSGIVSILANIGLLGLIIWVRLLTVHYYRLSNFFILLGLFSPVLVTNDLGALYDTSYLALIPLLHFATKTSHYFKAEEKFS